jgi:hypothetical protein
MQRDLLGQVTASPLFAPAVSFHPFFQEWATAGVVDE